MTNKERVQSDGHDALVDATPQDDSFNAGEAFDLVDLHVETTFADGKSPMTFSGRLVYKGTENGVADARINCSFVSKTAARFTGVDTDNPGVTRTAADGTFTVSFTDTVPVTTTIAAETQAQGVRAETTYQPLPPPLLTLETINDHAAADGHDEVTLVATLVRADTKMPYPQRPLLIIDPGELGELTRDSASGKQHTDAQGQVRLKVTSKKRGSGKATVTVDAARGSAASISYNFRSGWGGVAQATFNLGYVCADFYVQEGGADTVLQFSGEMPAINGDGEHRCIGWLNFVPTDSQGAPLNQNNCPTLEEIISAVALKATGFPGQAVNPVDDPNIILSWDQNAYPDDALPQFYPAYDVGLYIGIGKRFLQSVTPDKVTLSCLLSKKLGNSDSEQISGYAFQITPTGGQMVSVEAATPKSKGDLNTMVSDYLCIFPPGKFLSSPPA